MNEHVRYQELISRLLDEELSPDENEALARHLKECPDCAVIYAAFSSLSERIGADLEEPPAGLRENVMAQIRRDEIQKKNAGKRRWRVYVGLAAVLALVIFATPRLRMGRSVDFSGNAISANMSVASTVTTSMDSAAAAAEDDAVFYEEEAVEGAEFEAEMRVTADAAPRNAAPSYDLSERLSSAELAAFLGGASGEISREATLCCTVQTSDGEVLIYEEDGALLYLLPDLSVCTADQDLDALLNFLLK